MTLGEADSLALYGVPKIGTKTHARLVKQFGSATAVFEQGKQALMSLPGIGESTASNIISFDRDAFVKDQIERMEASGAVMISRGSADYPALLDKFTSAPPVLFCRGDISALHLPSLAFVGTRGATPYGRKMTQSLVSGIVPAGYCIVSGMAAGIDSIAHKTAIETGGKTVAVFGCGVDIIYPPENRKLSESIRESGCLVSHFPMGMEGVPGNFPARNSVITGLSLGTVVVEAGERSGALITADLTLKAKRKLFAVPGPADAKKSTGVNALLGKGALPATDAGSILGAFGKKADTVRSFAVPRNIPSGLAGEIVKSLDSGPRHVEEICSILGKPIHIILQQLTDLEMDGLIIQRPGKIFESS